MLNMAVFIARYMKSRRAAKAFVRYIQHRPGREKQATTRTLFGLDGQTRRQEAYQMIDEAGKGSRFFRLVISPDPVKEDRHADLLLREVTERTMQALEERLRTQVLWVGAVHADHTACRHVHLLAIIPGKLITEDLRAAREAATAACLQQRRERDLVLEAAATVREQKEAEWERSI